MAKTKASATRAFWPPESWFMDTCACAAAAPGNWTATWTPTKGPASTESDDAED